MKKKVKKTKHYQVAYNNCFGGFGLSKEAIDALNELGCDVDEFGCHPLTYKRISRHNPNLIKVISRLKEAANGPYADLKIAKISGNKYRIEEYDGHESVMEPDDYKFVVIENKKQ